MPLFLWRQRNRASLRKLGILCRLSVRPSVFMPPFEKGGAYCFAPVSRYVGRSVGRYVGMSVSLNLVQLITQECFAQEASNLVGK